MKFWTTTFVLSAMMFFFIHTVVLAAEEQCPNIDSPTATAIKFQLFSAYQTGYDGYAIPCELKCFKNQDCKKTCQTKEALRLLHAKLQDLTQKNDRLQCPAHTIGCIEQCESLGVSCLSACNRTKPVAAK